MIRRFLPQLIVPLAVTMVVLAYWPGLSGGFILDDSENFVQLERFARGDVSWIGPVVSNGSGPLGRPISMASFVASVAAGGYSPWVLKVGNLFLHVSIGALVAILATLLMRRDPRLTARAASWGAAIGLIWMGLPVHASTVLYAVQRMAQVSALFVVLGLIGYVMLRNRLEASNLGPWRATGVVGAWIAALTMAAAFGKENGLLLPLLCAAIEFTCYAADNRAARGVRTMLAAGLLAAAIGVTAVLMLRPDALLASYEIRAFTLWERLLTQPRVLWDYVASILLPKGPTMGLFQDDFPLSRSLISPWTTAPALAGWIGLLAAAVLLRRRTPVFACGVLLFLGGHAMESTFLPLEIYFEHRNYLPSFGVLLVAAAVIGWIGQSLPPTTASFRRVAPVLAVAIAIAMLAAVHGRASVWGDPDLLLAQSAINQPDSPRVQTSLAAEAMRRGDLGAAIEHFDRYDALTDGRERGVTMLWRIVALCRQGATVPDELWDAALPALPAAPSMFALRAAIVLGEDFEAGRCPGVSTQRAITLFVTWSARLTVDDRSHAAWRLRFIQARLEATAGQYAAALALGRQAWRDSGWNSGVGVFVVQVANSTNDRTAAKEALETLRQHAPVWDHQLQAAIGAFAQHLNAGSTDVSLSDRPAAGSGR